MLLGISDGGLQGSPLAFEALSLSLELVDVPVHLGDLGLCTMQVILLLPSQCLQLLILDLVHSLSLIPAAIGHLFVLDLDLSNDAVCIQGAAVVHGQHHRHVPEKVDLISRLFQERLQLYLVDPRHVAKLLLGQSVQLLPKVVDVAPEYVVHVAPSCFCYCRRLHLVSSILFCCSRNCTFSMRRTMQVPRPLQKLLLLHTQEKLKELMRALGLLV
ncbi:hypothetical protein AAY473_002696 [Plecturocebus cupreus]